MTTHDHADRVSSVPPTVDFDAEHDDGAPAPVAGKLATSGVDDQARGETVSGLGLKDVNRNPERPRSTAEIEQR